MSDSDESDASEATYGEVTTRLRAAYDGSVAVREGTTPEAWRLAEREGFLTLLQSEGKTTLLEIGAGAGQR